MPTCGAHRQECAGTDGAELMHCTTVGQLRPAHDAHVPCEICGNLRILLHDYIVADVAVGHDVDSVAQACAALPDSAFGILEAGGMEDVDVRLDDAMDADLDTTMTSCSEVACGSADGAMWEEGRVPAGSQRAPHHRLRADLAVLAEHDVTREGGSVRHHTIRPQEHIRPHRGMRAEGASLT
eukprot:CAMPEP_0203895306 /NCGR_PEP_ID=MMETSP0359-20131031/38165_1 /ASSEMBLY_ACC=CAM_ASM_000338 /TAXON_ID=268821 /ORGANISM="Scrippsiella Hangoei, Strain SHTV-5" /LENGTH=181 /DNA_ID=CAMNT_0050817759 /DNA_START=270 /DNA_END=811 /DNA_ORIENTATION=+